MLLNKKFIDIICLLLICLLIRPSYSSRSATLTLRETSCSDPSVREILMKSELKRRTGFTRIQCALNCRHMSDCRAAVDVTIGGQKTCVYLCQDRISVMPNYPSENDCRVLIPNFFELSCQSGYIGRRCEHVIPSHSDSRWISGTGPTNLEHKIRTVEEVENGTQFKTLVYTHSSLMEGPPLQTEGYPFMSFDFDTKSFALPATREARHVVGQSLQETRVYINGTRASATARSLSSVDVYKREKTDLSHKCSHLSPAMNSSAPGNCSEYFLKGYRNEDPDYSVMQRDSDNDDVWHYLLHLVKTNYTDPVRPLRFSLKRYNYEGTSMRKEQKWFSDTVYNRQTYHFAKDTYYDNCWIEAAENKVDVLKYVRNRVNVEGRPVRVVLNGNLSADALFLISTPGDLIAVMAPYVEFSDTDTEFPDPSIMVYTSVSSGGVQTQQKITYEGSAFQQVVNNGGGHDAKWFLGTRNWRRILRVIPSNDVTHGDESDLRDAANQGFSLRACAVLPDHSKCFGTRAVAIAPDGEVLMQSPPVPLIMLQSQGRVFLNVSDLQVIMLKSRGGCQRLVYKNGVIGGTLAACPGVKWLDWFVENY